jgi:formylglycine-generating enzyme required for sulfatase activity
LKLPTLLLTATLCLCSCGKETKKTTQSTIELKTGSGIEVVYVPAGTFMMGKENGDDDESPAHKVSLAGFIMDKFEVTHEMFIEAELPNPSHWQDDPKKPVEQIRWQEARAYCNERSIMEGLDPYYDATKSGFPIIETANGYRLPTEAEWEYTARSGKDSDYSFGSSRQLKLHSWFEGNSGKRTHRVGTKKPNNWGIHDLYGNVSEWCEDVYDPHFYKNSPELSPAGPETKSSDPKRVIRGGSWRASSAMCRVSFRRGERTGDTDACFFTDYCGFRCVRNISKEQLNELIK